MTKIFVIHIKILRGNFFLLISNQKKQLVFNKSCGNLGFKNIQKRNKDAFQNLLSLGLKYLSSLSVENKLFIKIEAAKKEIMFQIYNKFLSTLKDYNFNVFAIEFINKVSHNGCRKPYFRK